MRTNKTPKGIFIIAAVVVAVVGIYSALWFTQASVAKKQITAFISRINSNSEIITYDAITTEGFPSALIVRIMKPTIALPMKSLLKPIGEQMPPAPDGTDQAAMRKALFELPEWVETIALDGNIAFKVNTQSNSYQIEPVGDYEVTSKINNDTMRYSVIFEEGQRGCNLHFSQSKSGSALQLWNWDYLTDGEAALNALQKLECHAPGLKTYISKGSDASYTSAPITFVYENNGKGDTIDASLKLEDAEYFASAGLDRLMTHYYNALYPNEAMPLHYRMEPLGKQKINFDGSLAFNKVTPESAPIKIILKDFSYQSDITDSKNAFSIESESISGGAKVAWNLKSDTRFKEGAYENYLSQAKEYATSMYRLFNVTQPGVMKMDETSFVKQYQSIVPRIHELGNIGIAFAGNGELKDGLGMPLEIETLAINVNPYGVEAKGKGEIPSAMMPVPTGDYLLTCRGCFAMVDDVTAWFNRFQPLLKEMDAASYWATLQVTPQVVDGLKSFMQKLAPNDVDEFHYALALEKSGAISINKKPIEEVSALYEAELGKLLDAKQQSLNITPDALTKPHPIATSETLPPTL